MNALEFNLLASELASARANATLGASHLEQVRRVASISNGGIKTAPLHLAAYHFAEAAKLIDQALGKAPTPTAPTLDQMIELAKARADGQCGSHLSPSPAAETEKHKGSDSADAGEGDELSRHDSQDEQDADSQTGHPVNPVNPVQNSEPLSETNAQ